MSFVLGFLSQTKCLKVRLCTYTHAIAATSHRHPHCTAADTIPLATAITTTFISTYITDTTFAAITIAFAVTTVASTATTTITATAFTTLTFTAFNKIAIAITTDIIIVTADITTITVTSAHGTHDGDDGVMTVTMVVMEPKMC